MKKLTSLSAVLLLLLTIMPTLMPAFSGKPSGGSSSTKIDFPMGDVTSVIPILSTSMLSAKEFHGHGTLYLTNALDTAGDYIIGIRSYEGDLTIYISGGKSKTAQMFFSFKTYLDNDDIIDYVSVYSISYPGDVKEVSKTERRIEFKNDLFDVWYILSTPEDTPKYIGHWPVSLTLTIVLSTP